MEAKEEVRSRLSIEDVIGEYVQLKRAGRSYKGLSPFTSEKTPSFVVSPDKQIWHDFSSNRGGDVFSFVMEVEGIDFRAALELLARKAGVELEQYSGGDKKVADHKKRLLSALDLAATYYQQSLVQNRSAVEYVFKTRGFSKDIALQFRLGYAPGQGDALTRALLKRGFSPKELRDAGLSVERRGRLGDMFRARIMVPLSDGQGQVVGFTARLLDANIEAPKYINTPQTMLYDKGRQLYGLHLAKDAVRKNGRAVIVEGNLDVISSHQAGVANVVAAAGTALTEFHLKSLARLSDTVALAFDGDKAGIAATERAIDMAIAVGVTLLVVTLPSDAKDPDELIQQDPSAWAKAVNEARPVLDWVIDRYQGLYDVTTAAGKRELTTRALGVLHKLDDPVEREHYIGVLANVTGASPAALTEKLNGIGVKQSSEEAKRRLKPVAVAPKSPVKPLTVSEHDIRQDSLLALLASYPDVRQAAARLDPRSLQSEPRQLLAEYVLQHDDVDLIRDDLPSPLQAIGDYCNIVLLQAQARYGDWSDMDRYSEAARLVRLLADDHQKTQKADLDARLRAATEAGDESLRRELLQQLNDFIRGSRS